MFTEQKDGFTLRGEFDDDRIMWFPGVDIAKIRGKDRIRTHDLSKSGLRYGIDYKVIHVDSDLGRNLRLWSPGKGSVRRLLLSESGMYMLMMKGQSKRDRLLQYWLADQVIPAIRRHGEYELPADHPMHIVLKETSEMAKFYRDLVWEHSDLTVADLAGHAVGTTPDCQWHGTTPNGRCFDMKTYDKAAKARWKFDRALGIEQFARSTNDVGQAEFVAQQRALLRALNDPDCPDLIESPIPHDSKYYEPPS